MEHYIYKIGKLRDYAVNYHEKERIAYSGRRDWVEIVETLADLTIAAEATGRKHKLDRMKRDATYFMTDWDYGIMMDYLNWEEGYGVVFRRGE